MREAHQTNINTDLVLIESRNQTHTSLTHHLETAIFLGSAKAEEQKKLGINLPADPYRVQQDRVHAKHVPYGVRNTLDLTKSSFTREHL